jgi:hypothetical protein
VSALAGDLESDIVLGGSLDFQSLGRHMVEVFCEQLNRMLARKGGRGASQSSIRRLKTLRYLRKLESTS